MAEPEDESLIAILMPDTAPPCLKLWEETTDQNLPQGYGSYTYETRLYARLDGAMCSSSTSTYIDIDQLEGLSSVLQSISSMRSLEEVWNTYNEKLEIRLRVLTDKFGPPVSCDVWLRDDAWYDRKYEEHHCSFETNLGCIDAFLARVEAIAIRYRRVRGWPDQDREATP